MLYQIKLLINYDGRIKTFSVHVLYQSISTHKPTLRSPLRMDLTMMRKKGTREEDTGRRKQETGGAITRKTVKEDPRISAVISCHSVTQKITAEITKILTTRMCRGAWP